MNDKLFDVRFLPSFTFYLTKKNHLTTYRKFNLTFLGDISFKNHFQDNTNCNYIHTNVLFNYFHYNTRMYIENYLEQFIKKF